MFYVTLQQQLCGKHDVWHNFQDEKYFKKEKNLNFVTLAQLTKYSCNTTKQSTESMHFDRFLMKLSKILNQQLHVRFTRYCLVIKFFTLYSAKYIKKTGFKSLVQEDATFHCTFILFTQIGGKLETILNKLPKKHTVHVLHQICVCTSDHWRILQHTFQCLRPGEWSHSGEVTWHARCCR